MCSVGAVDVHLRYDVFIALSCGGRPLYLCLMRNFLVSCIASRLFLLSLLFRFSFFSTNLFFQSIHHSRKSKLALS
ncbi:hypothetical protein V8B97DRAFT_1998889 [Scleroderma yunnanense]